MALSAEQKEELIQTHRKHDKDTGSPEAQVALINARIRQLTDHFRTHRKDHHSRYGLFKLVGKQRRLLRYLYKKDSQRYYQLINQLGIRDTLGSRGN
ncbi:MAG: 30S ribosomal protein S15 [Candidatus Poribacteria bacterium]|nr:30S ribosomal protein S15 [Candidatus Poribacteria bacterium]MDE0506074.1 30S ribosomal protein S15 [Candidatus Poribacteria bacterium]